jgi:Na+/melibiose symporter-like transporter
VRTAFAVVASMLAVALPPVIVLGVSGGGDLAASAPLGWAVLGVAFGLIVIAGYLALPRSSAATARRRAVAATQPWWTVPAPARLRRACCSRSWS